MLTKGEWIGRHRSGDLKYSSLKIDEIDIHVHNGYAAVVTGKETSSVSYKGSSMPEDQFRVMEVFVRQGENAADGWRLAAKQFSPILGALNVEQHRQALTAQH